MCFHQKWLEQLHCATLVRRKCTTSEVDSRVRVSDISFMDKTDFGFGSRHWPAHVVVVATSHITTRYEKSERTASA